jgi:hypothetical protein
MATLTCLPAAQSRLINLLHQTSGAKFRPPANTALAQADADPADLDHLARARFVTADDGHEQHVEILDCPVDALRHVFLTLTPLGVDWVTGDPGNQVLRVLGDGDRRQVQFREVIKRTGVDPVVLLQLEDGGLLQITLGESGTPLRQQLLRSLRHPGSMLHVHLTTKGQQYLP